MKDRYNGQAPWRSREYNSWSNMIGRCFNKKNHKYKDYGARGITVCKRWKKFKNFLKDMGKRPTRYHSLDRIDNDGNYCKRNCRWSLRGAQANNTRRNRVILFRGTTKTLAQWCDCLGLSYKACLWRLNANWPTEQILTVPTKKGNNKTCRW